MGCGKIALAVLEKELVRRLEKSIKDKSSLSTDPGITGYFDLPRFHDDLKPQVPNKYLSINKKIRYKLVPIITDHRFLKIVHIFLLGRADQPGEILLGQINDKLSKSFLP